VIDFADQVAIVTGAGRGLGRLYALELARRGARVVVNDLGTTMHGRGSDASVADHVVAEIEREGGIAVASHDSVATSEGGAAIVGIALKRFGRVDAVVSNAGIFSTMQFDELPVEEWRRMLSVHLDGAFHLAQPAYRAMKAQGYGRFVLVSSSAGAFGQPASAHYAAAKAGVIALSKTLALELAPHKINVNSVAPGIIDTPFVAPRRTKQELIAIGERIPLGRVGHPDDVARVVVFLASSASEYMTGQTLFINGGALMP
jgi:NAD(P)-dependent dehydrogenase (short-subunit alcohol dehydrogenase family)